MNHLSRISTFALSTAVLGLAIAGCQPQGQPSAPQETAAADATMTVAPEAAAEAESTHVMNAAEISELLVGNTVIGVYDAWNLTWAEYFSPDGTTKLLLRFEGKDDMKATGKHYSNNKDQFCTEDPQQNVYCSNLISLGDGRYQQVYEGGEKGSIYNQILLGDQIEAFR